MLPVLRPFRALSIAFLLGVIGCHAQTPAKGTPVSPEVSWRIESLLRTNANLPPETEIVIGDRQPSEFSGYDTVPVTFRIDGQSSPPTLFLLSTDNKTVGQMRKFPITDDPAAKVSSAGRPSRGGPAGAPIQIVIYDDLQCPFCARMSTQLIPALLQRYGNSVHVVYRDFPLSQHAWAMRASIDVNCLAAQSPDGYWNLVDFIHAHASDLWDGDAKSLPRTNDQLDLLVRDEGKRQHADSAKLDACLAKQDRTAIDASLKEGESIGIGATPAIFVNGNRIDGAVSPEFLFKIVDKAMVVAGKMPPPPYAPPAPPVQAAAPAKTAPQSGH